MKNTIFKLSAIGIILIGVYFLFQNKESNINVTKHSFSLDNNIESRINSLIETLTIEEKVGQTCQITLDALLIKDDKGTLLEPHQIDQQKLEEALLEYNVGSILNVSNHTFTLEIWRKIITNVQNTANTSNHRIPIIYGIDAIHGATYIQNSTLFPQEIGLAATWDTSHARIMGEITAYETRASGVSWNFSPVLDLGRQPIWSTKLLAGRPVNQIGRPIWNWSTKFELVDQIGRPNWSTNSKIGRPSNQIGRPI